MKPEIIYYEALLYPAASGWIKKHPCKKDCGNHSCPIQLQRAIAKEKLFLTQMNVTGNSPVQNDPDILKVIVVRNSVHLSTVDPITQELAKQSIPISFSRQKT